jgi:hypothetical protein
MPPDSTNAGTPGPGGTLSGDLTKMYAQKRMQRQQNQANAAQTGKVMLPPGPPKIRRF